MFRTCKSGDLMKSILLFYFRIDVVALVRFVSHFLEKFMVPLYAIEKNKVKSRVVIIKFTFYLCIGDLICFT